ncbi:MAG: hypothetical protein ACI4QN_00450 [Candidatus Coproplasma sp.]
MQKLVVKTAVKTVLILLGIVIAAFAIFNFAFPQHMATAMEALGSYGMAVKYANLRYTYTQDSFDLARCYDDSVLAGDDESIIIYAEKLIADKNYDNVCAQRNGLYNNIYNGQFGFSFDYDLRVRSSVSVSYYNEALKKEGENRETYVQKAINFALEANGTTRFPYGNALMILSIKIANNDDVAAAESMLAALDGITPTDADEMEDLSYFKNKLKGVTVAVQ